MNWINTRPNDVIILEYQWQYRHEKFIESPGCLFISFKTNNKNSALEVCNFKWNNYTFEIFDQW